MNAKLEKLEELPSIAVEYRALIPKDLEGPDARLEALDLAVQQQKGEKIVLGDQQQPSAPYLPLRVHC